MRTLLNFFLLFTFCNVVYGQEDMEVLLLPTLDTDNNNFKQVPLNFTAFGEKVNLLLERNDKLLAPSFHVLRHDDGDETRKVPELSKLVPCHYLHSDCYSSAAISLCHSRSVHGVIFLENVTYEIFPVKQENDWHDRNDIKKRSANNFGELHIIKRSRQPTQRAVPSLLFKRNAHISRQLFAYEKRNSGGTKLTIELALFLDESGYKLFAPFFQKNEAKMKDMLLAYVNGIQALYHHPSLGDKIDIALVRLEMMQKQPSSLPHYNGDRSRLLNSFCAYSKSRNSVSDDDPNHWDIGLYISGLDFYVFEGGRKNSITMGLATVGGACLNDFSCVIAEFGVTNNFGKPYPSAGFTSVYIAAHEIGHNLGMHHDSTGNTCPKDGYIMSPSRGTQGETIWSACSRDVVQRLPSTMSCLLDKPQKKHEETLDHHKFHNLPGRKWDAKKQCELLLRDEDATVVTLHNACLALQCKTPHRSGHYFAGPALDGTYCGEGRECRAGECQVIFSNSFEEFNIAREGGWSAWKEETCKSGCIQRSQGIFSRRRVCDNPKPINTNAGCDGPAYDVQLCKDDRLCKKIRRSAVEYATMKCGIFSQKLPDLVSKGNGLQAPHEIDRSWMSCAIFCRRKGTISYYTPRVELNDLGLDPYFPDGTWCHRENGEDYFCRQHHCLPENFRFGKDLISMIGEDDMQIGPQNAHPGKRPFPEQLVKYLSLGVDGRPLLSALTPDIGTPPDADDWTDKDYIELPKSLDKRLYPKESASASWMNFM